MDRRNNNEAAGDLTDEQFSKALEVITDSYKGASPDRLYRGAIGCFACLMEISHNTEAITTFARRHDIDLKYLVDGANFVISRMHFNPENNYYITLGLRQNVSNEEIRERWKKLMLLYHPDRQGGDDSWVSERAKKVNEAYTVLKDNEKRQSFDRRLLEQAVARKPVPQSGTGPGAASSRSGRKISRDPAWDRKKKNIPKFLVGMYLIVALIFLGYLYLRNNGEHLERALSRKEGPAEQADLMPDAVSEKEGSNDSATAGPQGPAENTDKTSVTSQALHVTGLTSKGKTTGQRPVMAYQGNIRVAEPAAAPAGTRNAAGQNAPTHETFARDGSAPETTSPVLPLQASKSAQDAQPMPRAPEPKAYAPMVKDTPAAGHSQGKPETHQSVTQEVPSAHPVPKVQPAGLTHEEVKDFMKRYSNAYSKGDLNVFMSLLSKSVVENDRLHYNAVREAYRQTFAEKINSYRVNNMVIMLNGQNASVSGVYELKRYTSAEDRWIRYSGKIQWNISKENSELKIISINYDK